MEYIHPFIEKLQSKTPAEASEPRFLTEIRAAAMKELKEGGIPHNKLEDWLYTNIEPLFGYDWNCQPQGLENINLEEVFKCDVPDMDTYLVIFFNGKYYVQNQTFPKGVTFYSVADLIKNNPALLEKYLFKAVPVKKAVSAFNALLFQDGYFLHIEKGTIIDKPIQLVNASIGNTPYFVNQHNIIVAEENSHVQIIGCDHTLSPTRFFNNHITEIYVENNATLEYYSSQNAHNENSLISSLFVEQKANSHFLSAIISLHGGLIRNELTVNLRAPGAECHAYGLNLTDRKQHVDSFTQIHHLAPHCTSYQNYKGIYDDEATGAFTGRIVVHKGAQKTEAYQSNRNILLTSQAKVNSRPQLEIYADDVKCSHGATTGQLDSNALFYMQARGIDRKEARMLLMYAFANEIVSKIKVAPLSHRIEGLVNRRLRGELSRCANCVIHCG